MISVIKKANDVLKYCKNEQKPLCEVAIEYELSKGVYTREQVQDKMKANFELMQEAVMQGLKGTEKGACKMFRDEAKHLMTYRQDNKTLSGGVVTKAAAYALAVMEINCSMGRIVAAPTAGACGVLPAVIIVSLENLDLPNEKGVHALLTAGLVGMIIGKNASLSGAQGGCQAEIGSATAMAAAAITEMAGGTPKQSFDAAAIALKAMMGLVCDPVAGLVEVPCAKRNAIGAGNALLASDMVLAGIKSVIPFDEVVWAMNKVGRAMPDTLKETAEGGVAITETGKKLKKEIFGN